MTRTAPARLRRGPLRHAPLRPTLGLLGAASLALTAVVAAAPAEAAPRHDAAQRRAETCALAVAGWSVSGARKAVGVSNGTVGDTTAYDAEKLAFQPTGYGYEGYREDTKTRDNYFLFQQRNGVVKATAQHIVKKSGKTSWQRFVALKGKRKSDVFVGSQAWGAYAYLGDEDGLRRYTWKAVNGGTTLARGPKVTSTAFSALVSMGRWKVDGAITEILYGVTADGALEQLRMKKGNIDHLVETVVAETGFEGVDELSWGLCKVNDNGVPLVSIDRDAASGEQARYQLLENGFKPQPADLGEPTALAGTWTFDAVS